MKRLAYFTEQNTLEIHSCKSATDGTEEEPASAGTFVIQFSTNRRIRFAQFEFENEDKPSLAKFLREVADELDRTKP